MKLGFCLLAAVFTAVSYGWGLGDALKAVDKAASTVTGVNNTEKSAAQQPLQTTGASGKTAESATVTPAASKLKWDASGYTAKLAKVNEAMTNVMKKMPLRGEAEQWYDAAYQFTSIDRQFSFLKPEQLVGRINQNMQGNVDKFLTWVEGGMQTANIGNQPAAGAPAAPAGYYQQQPAQGNAQTANRSANTATSQQSNVLTDAEESKFRKECLDIIKEALTHKEYKLDRKSLESVAFDLIDQEKKIQGHIGRAKADMSKNGLLSRINAAKAECQYMANKNKQKLNAELERLRQLIKECDECVGQCDGAIKSYETKAGSVAKLLPKSVKEEQQERVEKLSSARGDRGVSKVELPKDDPFKAEILMLFPADVTSYKEGKIAGSYAESEDLDDVKKKVSTLEDLKGKMNQAVNGEYGFVKTCERVASDIENDAGTALKKAEADFKILLDNSSMVLSEEDKKTFLAEAEKMKKTLNQGEYVNQLMAKKESLEKEIKSLDEKRVARLNLVHKIRRASAGEWKKAIDAESTDKDKKRLLKDLFCERGADEKFCKDPIATELFNQYFAFDDIVASMRNEKDLSGFWVGTGLFITDQTILKDILITNDKWAGTWRDGIPTMNIEALYYGLYKNVTDQSMLLQLLDIKEINFKSMDMDSYGHRDKAVFALLNKDNMKFLDKKREARLNAVKGQIINCKGFYVGMLQRDFTLLKFEREVDGKGCVTGGLDGDSMSPMQSITFNAKMRYEYLGIKKDGLEGLLEFIGKYVDGGNDSVGEAKIDATTSISWFYVDSPKFDCQIRMYKDGDLRIKSTRGLGESHKLDFSKSK